MKPLPGVVSVEATLARQELCVTEAYVVRGPATPTGIAIEPMKPRLKIIATTKMKLIPIPSTGLTSPAEGDVGPARAPGEDGAYLEIEVSVDSSEQAHQQI